MPIPYRKSPKSAATQCAAYLEIIWLKSTRTFYGGLLLIDSRGQPIEFVHNTLQAPAGFLWPEDQVRSLGVATLCHSLFEACQREPELIVGSQSLGSAAYCKNEIAPMIPFAQVVDSTGASPAAWNWMNDPPTQGMGAHSLGETLRGRGFATEPLTRIREGLREVYPHAPWNKTQDDTSTQSA